MGNFIICSLYSLVMIFKLSMGCMRNGVCTQNGLLENLNIDGRLIFKFVLVLEKL